MVWRLVLGLLAASAPAGCGPFPDDPRGTTARVVAEGRFRLGVIEAEPQQAVPAARAALVASLARETGARPIVERGPSDRLFVALEDGDLDLVVGPVAGDSPWRRRVTALPPLAGDVAAFARNGENRWIALLHRLSRRAAAR